MTYFTSITIITYDVLILHCFHNFPFPETEPISFDEKDQNFEYAIKCEGVEDGSYLAEESVKRIAYFFGDTDSSSPMSTAAVFTQNVTDNAADKHRKRHRCELCQQTFTRRDNLLRHMRRLH